MKLNDFDTAHVGAARAQPAFRAGRGGREFVEALMARLMTAWVRLYGIPPRQLPPLL
jgi:hypothetical protein